MKSQLDASNQRVRGSLHLSLISLFLLGCNPYGSLPSVKKAFENVQEWELYSIDPKLTENTVNLLHEHQILGKTTSKDSDLLQKILSELRESDTPSACSFNPRHAIRAVIDGRRFDLMICFECSMLFVYIDDNISATNRSITISRTLEPALDEILISAKVPLAPKPKK